MLSFLVVSCSTVKAPTYFEITNSWKGFHIDKLAEVWGKPTGAFFKPNGNRVYAYEISRTRRLPSVSRYVGDKLYVFPAPTVVETCNTYFETDSKGVIVGSTYEGNACP
jgi:hypothetical protein